MNICAGMREAGWLEQNAVLNALGMRAMAKHPFSPCSQRGFAAQPDEPHISHLRRRMHLFERSIPPLNAFMGEL